MALKLLLEFGRLPMDRLSDSRGAQMMYIIESSLSFLSRPISLEDLREVALPMAEFYTFIAPLYIVNAANTRPVVMMKGSREFMEGHAAARIQEVMTMVLERCIHYIDVGLDDVNNAIYLILTGGQGCYASTYRMKFFPAYNLNSKSCLFTFFSVFGKPLMKVIDKEVVFVWSELDAVSRCNALIGRRMEVYRQKRWHSTTLTSYDPAMDTFSVFFDDGDLRQEDINRLNYKWVDAEIDYFIETPESKLKMSSSDIGCGIKVFSSVDDSFQKGVIVDYRSSRGPNASKENTDGSCERGHLIKFLHDNRCQWYDNLSKSIYKLMEPLAYTPSVFYQSSPELKLFGSKDDVGLKIKLFLPTPNSTSSSRYSKSNNGWYRATIESYGPPPAAAGPNAEEGNYIMIAEGGSNTKYGHYLLFDNGEKMFCNCLLLKQYVILTEVSTRSLQVDGFKEVSGGSCDDPNFSPRQCKNVYAPLPDATTSKLSRFQIDHVNAFGNLKGFYAITTYLSKWKDASVPLEAFNIFIKLIVDLKGVLETDIARCLYVTIKNFALKMLVEIPEASLSVETRKNIRDLITLIEKSTTKMSLVAGSDNITLYMLELAIRYLNSTSNYEAQLEGFNIILNVVENLSLPTNSKVPTARFRGSHFRPAPAAASLTVQPCVSITVEQLAAWLVANNIVAVILQLKMTAGSDCILNFMAKCDALSDEAICDIWHFFAGRCLVKDEDGKRNVITLLEALIPSLVDDRRGKLVELIKEFNATQSVYYFSIRKEWEACS